MLQILWKREEIAPEEQFLLSSTIFCYLMLDFYVKTRIRFSLRDKRLFEITEVEITRVDCMWHSITSWQRLDIVSLNLNRFLLTLQIEMHSSLISLFWLVGCFGFNGL